MNKELIVPSGIGDLAWVLKTMIQEPHDFLICKSQQYRAWQLLDLVPSLVNSYKECNTPFSYTDASITQLNKHLETGNRIEKFTGAVYELPLQTEQYKARACKLLKKKAGTKLIGIYTSTLKHGWVKSGQAWKPETWVAFLKEMQGMNPDVRFALFGAEYDADMAVYLKDAGVQFTNCVGKQHLGVSLEAMKKCDAFIGFPSGLTVLAHEIGLPTIMFFPNEARHVKMHNTFNWLGSVEDGTWKGCTFPRLDQIFKWMATNKVFTEILNL